ncbi:hypothetical protein K431DRAFT_280186 [Polychaeton citri CBS 116435]|uniref:Uncharacterized protein n=1 Tax=Polychaeton citri CBS 116435 TaxID=1314669 RepID=A0A9P4UUW3_9PEZI|nr:hypothetical protein K431DRAFT_280186 [Polychaeton citri CBS 116435]
MSATIYEHDRRLAVFRQRHDDTMWDGVVAMLSMVSLRSFYFMHCQRRGSKHLLGVKHTKADQWVKED